MNHMLLLTYYASSLDIVHEVVNPKAKAGPKKAPAKKVGNES